MKQREKSITEMVGQALRHNNPREALLREHEARDELDHIRDEKAKSQRLGFFCLGVLLGVLGTLGVTL